MPVDKLLAEWFWTDRWIGSSAFGLSYEARGLYREMLTQAWRRGARLPNDHAQIQRMTGGTEKEWRRAWPLVKRYWRVEGDWLVNDTQREIYADAQGRSARATERARKAAQALHKQSASTAQAALKQDVSTAQALLDDCPLSPSPSLIEDVQKASTAASPPRAPKFPQHATHPADDGNLSVILKLAHEVMDASGLLDPSDPELLAQLKDACAKASIDYGRDVDPDVCSRALKSAARARSGLIPARKANGGLSDLVAELQDAPDPETLGERIRTMADRRPRR